MQKRFKFYIALFFVTLAACTVGKNYQRPDLPVPQEFRGVTTSDTSSIADIEWKQFFTDTTLQGLISRGIAYNYDLQLAIKRMDEAKQRVKQAKLLQLPELNLQATAQTNNPSNNSLNGISLKSFLEKNHLEDYTVAANLSWEADIWGKIRRQKEAALAEYLKTSEAAKAVQTQLVADIAQGFFNMLMLDEQLDIAKKNLIITDSTLFITRLQRDGGEVTTLAVQQAEVQRQTTALLIPQLENDIAVQENALSILTGALPGDISRNIKLSDFNVPDHFATGLPAAVVSRRPDVRAYEMSLVGANAEVGIAQAYMYPALNITATGGLNSFKASNWFNIPASLFGIVAGSLAEPVFQHRELKTQFEIAKIQRDEAVIQFRQSVLNAAGEVSNALITTDKLKTQQQIASAQVDTLQHAIKNARLLFKSGMANYLEVLTAQRNALLAELNLASIQREQLGAMVELYRSLGGGWK
ncbi:MAG TPA: efflux transporter outer membrane subunit [Chitinophagaceae bacterium]|jgi:NodT family efflux transporter outer membrane factor (OMF) lipoprotein